MKSGYYTFYSGGDEVVIIKIRIVDGRIFARCVGIRHKKIIFISDLIKNSVEFEIYNNKFLFSPLDISKILI